MSGARPEHPKGLVVDASLTAAERIYLYVHLAAHVALRHNVPVMTIVEARGEPTSDVPLHRDAEELARAMWWGLTADNALAVATSRPGCADHQNGVFSLGGDQPSVAVAQDDPARLRPLHRQVVGVAPRCERFGLRSEPLARRR